MQKLLSRSSPLPGFAGLALTSFLLRIPYAGHTYADDGLWFTATEEILRGKALYREIYFDKPPALPLVYAGLFKIFGPHILTIRLFTIVYAIAISAVIFLFGARLSDRRTGFLAAALFAVFSTTGHSNLQGLDTHLLMILPYTAGAYLMIRSRTAQASAERGSGWLALVGGSLTGLAFQVNPKGIFNLLFFAILLVTIPPVMRGAHALRLILLAAAGFIAGSLPFLVYVAATGSLPAYWLYLSVWGYGYASYFALGTVMARGLLQTVSYFALNNRLLFTLLFVAGHAINRVRRSSTKARTPDSRKSDKQPERDLILLLWFATSNAGLAVGGRFFPHYFLQVLPSLCLIGAFGLIGMVSALKTLRPLHRQAALAVLITGFVFTLVRFHGRTAVLAADWLRGTKSQSTLSWGQDQRNQEESLVAAFARGQPSPDDAGGHFGVEGMQVRGPSTRSADGAPAHLFVWGYRPEIYYRSGLLPASRYLDAQPLTGIPGDVRYDPNERKKALPEALTARERAKLIQDLQQTKPNFIIDELESYAPDLSIQSYPELREFMRAYEPAGRAVSLLIYRRRPLP